MRQQENKPTGCSFDQDATVYSFGLAKWFLLKGVYYAAKIYGREVGSIKQAAWNCVDCCGQDVEPGPRVDELSRGLPDLDRELSNLGWGIPLEWNSYPSKLLMLSISHSRTQEVTSLNLSLYALSLIVGEDTLFILALYSLVCHVKNDTNRWETAKWWKTLPDVIMVGEKWLYHSINISDIVTKVTSYCVQYVKYHKRSLDPAG